MPNTLGRNLNLCFTKITRPLTLHYPDNDHSRPLPTAAADATTATTSTSSTSLMIKNFNSLYDDQYMFDSTTTSKSLSSSVSSSETDTDAPAADFATAFASRRFFFSSPGRSNSIVDQSASSPSSIAASSESPDHKLVNHSVAVPTFSPDPYRDFRRSMQEMVEAREGMKNEEEDGEKKKSNWEFLHELLLCYLALNPKSTHKFIIGAFADLLVSLMPSPGGVDRRELPEFTAGVCEISRCV
ncbi:hypothetical protein ACE6H2_028530 [Prunus campanulata]